MSLFSVVKVIDTQWRDPINSEFARWLVSVLCTRKSGRNGVHEIRTKQKRMDGVTRAPTVDLDDSQARMKERKMELSLLS